jgi:4-hydroxy-2-oxoheptanedioate aldolase
LPLRSVSNFNYYFIKFIRILKMSLDNKFKKKMSRGQPVIGCWLSMGSSIAAEIIATSGYDAVVLDHEHGPGHLQGATSLLQALGEDGPTPIMRVPWNDAVYIKRALDIGMMGIIIPYVQNAEEARAAVAACHYPLAGIRGVAPHAGRCSRWGMRLEEYLNDLPKKILVICQIETEEAISNIDEIAAVPGVDMLFMGPSDISASIGKALVSEDPQVKRIYAKCERKMRASGKLLGTVTRPGKTVEWTYRRGFDFVIAGSDAKLLASAAQSQVSNFRLKQKHIKKSIAATKKTK